MRFGWLLLGLGLRVTVFHAEKVPVHDFLIALAFVAMVTSPAVVVASPRAIKREDR